MVLDTRYIYNSAFFYYHHRTGRNLWHYDSRYLERVKVWWQALGRAETFPCRLPWWADAGDRLGLTYVGLEEMGALQRAPNCWCCTLLGRWVSRRSAGDIPCLTLTKQSGLCKIFGSLVRSREQPPRSIKAYDDRCCRWTAVKCWASALVLISICWLRFTERCSLKQRCFFWYANYSELWKNMNCVQCFGSVPNFSSAPSKGVHVIVTKPSL